MNIKKEIPNMLTLGNLFCGCLCIFCCIAGMYRIKGFYVDDLYSVMIILISGSLFFDLLDGMVARKLGVSSAIGLQLDSLADMVSFGVLPAFLMSASMHEINLSLYPNPTNFGFINYAPFLGLLIALLSAYRLAKFNIDENPTVYFKGLATPANTVLIFGVFYGVTHDFFPKTVGTYIGLVVLTLISSILLVSNIPLLSFKVKKWTLKAAYPQFIFIGISILFLILVGLNSLALIILLYILLSILFKKNIIS